jgi:hypothetical protein
MNYDFAEIRLLSVLYENFLLFLRESNITPFNSPAMEKKPCLFNSHTPAAPETISIDEADQAKQQELINSVLTTITIREYAKYERRAKADGNPDLGYQKDIVFLLRSNYKDEPQRRTYRIHIDPNGMTALVQEKPGETRTTPPTKLADSWSASHLLYDSPVCDPGTGSHLPAYQPKNVVYPCSRPDKPSKAASESQPTHDARVIPLPLKKRLTVGHVPSLPAEAGDRPQFRFGGTYLEKFGFFSGTKVSMHVEHRKIVLTVDESDSAALND